MVEGRGEDEWMGMNGVEMNGGMNEIMMDG